MIDMPMPYFAGVDLNLLAPLAALLDERHVSHAAARVGLTQPAMSQALRRLRTTLGDELLVRGPDGYVLTPRAERLQKQLAGVVPQLDEIFAEEPFVPARASERFRLAGTDYTAMVLGPDLSQRLFKASPESSLRLRSWHATVFDDLVRGTLDLVFYGSSPPSHLRTEELFGEHFVCVVDETHPLAASENAPSLATYLAYSHVVIEITDGEQAVLDRHLQAVGTPRKVALTVPYHVAAAAAVAGTPLVATLPFRLLSQVKLDDRLRMVPAPAEIERMTYMMVWHPRVEDDPAQRWLRELVRTTVAAF